MPRRKIIYAGLGCQALYSLKKSGKFCHGRVWLANPKFASIVTFFDLCSLCFDAYCQTIQDCSLFIACIERVGMLCWEFPVFKVKMIGTWTKCIYHLYLIVFFFFKHLCLFIF